MKGGPASTLPERLAANARQVFSLAPGHCQARHACLLYHRLWPLARLARGEPYGPAGADFLQANLDQLNTGAASRVLIAGAADTGLLELVYHCVRSSGNSVHYVLADRCGTVIRQNQLLAQQLNIELECHQQDLLSLDCAAVDLIVAHSVLGFFAPDARHSLYGRWLQLLNDRGRVLLSNLMHEAMPAQPLNLKSPLSPAQFMSAARHSGFSAGELAELQALVQQGWRFEGPGHRAPLREDFLDQVQEAGFRVDHVQGHAFDQQQRGPLIGGDYSNSQRLEVVLGKP